MRIRLILLVSFLCVSSAARAETLTTQLPWLEARRTCKQVRNCEEAVLLWCNGYRRADGDNDGIPCENVCSSVRQVNQIRKQIGC